MDVISISDSTDVSVAQHSSLYHYSQEHLEASSSSSVEPESLSSESSRRRPVTWTSKQKNKFDLMQNLIKEPCANTKVHSWLKRNGMENKTESADTFKFQKFDGNSLISLETLNRGGAILIRHDYEKDFVSCNSEFSYSNAKAYYRSKTDFSTSESSKLKDCESVNGVHGLVKGHSEIVCLDSDDESSERSVAGLRDGLKVLQRNQKQNNTGNDVPLSPETQKKNELCSYLQLMNMNCPEKKTGSGIQNRRSIRVKNLNILSERRKLERRLVFEAKERERNNVSTDNVIKTEDDVLCKIVACNSFAELEMNISELGEHAEHINNCQNVRSQTGNVKSGVSPIDSLSINILPREFLERVSDFDETMRNFINMENISVGDSFPMNGVKANTSENKLEIMTRRKLLTFTPGKYRNLRSNKKLSAVGLKKLMLKEERKKKNERNTLIRKVACKRKRQGTVRVSKLFKTKKSKNLFLKKSRTRKKMLKKKTESTQTNAVSDVKTIVIKDLEKTAQSNLECNCVNGAASSWKKAEEPVTKKSPINKRKDQTLRRHHKLSPRETQLLLKSSKAFREKKFSIIDLSHQQSYMNGDTLADHDYASKPEIDKNYIMNVIVGQPLMDENKKDLEALKHQDVEAIPGNDKKILQNVIEIFPKTIAGGQLPFDADNQDVAQEQDTNKTPIEFNYIGEELSLTVRNNTSTILDVDKINDKPPKTIYDDSYYCRSPSMTVTLSGSMCIKSALGGKQDLKEANVLPVLERSKDLRTARDKIRCIPFNSTSEIKSLQKNLIRSKCKSWSQRADLTSEHASYAAWDDELKKRNEKKSYSIRIAGKYGHILNAFYLDFNLVVAQEQVISFWSQSALGHMLGAQNMWISKGTVQRLVSDGNCVFKKSSQTVISLENSVAYVELWIKEHKSDKRERPVADIFATIYFCRHRLNGPDKKVLQLENIHGCASDVQYVVLRNSRNIIVSWCETCDDVRKTYIHCYNLASDYQTVVSIREMGNVSHYIASLHNIEDCDTLVMGCGEHKVTLWNVEYSYVVATVDVNDIRSYPRTLWVKCDRGFLFVLQCYELEKMFKLIAINGINHSWKRLKVFTFPSGYKDLHGVCVDNNILAAFYDNGVICWNIQTGESVIEEMCSENVYIPSEKHIVILAPSGILVRHALSHFITSYDL